MVEKPKCFVCGGELPPNPIYCGTCSILICNRCFNSVCRRCAAKSYTRLQGQVSEIEGKIILEMAKPVVPNKNELESLGYRVII
jgi:hypothetical protein